VKEKPSKNSNQWQTLASRGGGGAGGVGDFGSLAGVAQINQGGTGQTTRVAALNALLPDQAGSTQYMLLTDGSGTVSWGAQPVAGLPSQTSNSGRLLTTDGTNASWSNAVTVSGSNATVTGTLTGNSTITGANLISSVNSGAANGSEFTAFSALVGTDASLGPCRINIGALPSATFGSRYGYIACYDSGDYRKLYLGGSPGIAATGGQILIPATIASTTTSTGALVVSGGVGVGGSQYLGVKLNISTHTGDAGGIGFGTETNLYRYQAGGLALDHASGAAPGFIFRENGTSTLRLETNSGVGYLSTLTLANLIFRTNATTALTLDTSQNATFAGRIRTSAPSGGTAANWKLGTVASVSPTSPNRTIEVEIGGTTYYLHAKTTNN
jgi:hypothetical protein